MSQWVGLLITSIICFFLSLAITCNAEEPVPETPLKNTDVNVSRECGALIYSMIQLAGLEDEELKLQVANARKGNPLAMDTVTVSRAKVETMAQGFEEFFRAVYGDTYTPEYLPPIADKVCKQLRSVSNLYQLTGRAFVPCEVLLGIEEKHNARAERINKLRQQIYSLRQELGASVEYLTPATLAAVDIFRDVGRSRNLAGGGVREALKPVALAVRDNVDDLFRSLSANAVHDDTLRDLLIVVAKLVKYGVINPNSSKAVRAACHELVVANLSEFDANMDEKTFQTLAWLTENPAKNDSEYAKYLPKMADLVQRARSWQAQSKERLAKYARGYYRGRIAFNVISLMSRPNGYAGIPLGSPMRDALASLENHPSLLTTTMRAYEDSNTFLSLSVGEVLKSDEGPRTLLSNYGVHAADKFLMGRLITDDRLYLNFRLGYEYELAQTRDLLIEEKRARRWSKARDWVSAVVGGGTKDSVSKSKFLQTILPGRLLDALLLQVETGAQAGSKEGAAKFRKRAVQPLPVTIKDYLTWDPELFPWLVELPRSRPTHSEAEVDREFLETLPAATQAPASAAQPEMVDQRPLEPATISTDVVAERYLWTILKPMEDRAASLLERDYAYQEADQRRHRSGDQMQIQALALDIAQLLRAALKVQAALEASFRQAGLSPEDAEETLAWHMLKRTPTLAMYVVSGPPGPPRINPPVLTAQAGLSWRIAMMAPRLSYGDGTQDEPIFTNGHTENPNGKSRTYRKEIAIALVTAAAIWGGKPMLERFAQRMGWMSPPAASAPVTPGETAPAPVTEPGPQTAPAPDN